jgi:uncharacterized protein YaeQ
MEKEMRTLYVEGLATQDDPEVWNHLAENALRQISSTKDDDPGRTA